MVMIIDSNLIRYQYHSHLWMMLDCCLRREMMRVRRLDLIDHRHRRRRREVEAREPSVDRRRVGQV